MTSLIIFGGKYLFLGSLALVFYFFWKSSSDTRKSILKIGAVSLPTTYLIGLIARSLYDNPRPFVVDKFTPLIEHTVDNGFPSDHILLLGAVSSLLLMFDKRIALISWIITLLVAISRVTAGVHHTLDVATSMIISVAVIGVIYFINKKHNATKHF